MNIIHAAISSFSTKKIPDFGPNFVGPYLMNDSDFQVAIVLIIFDLFQYTKKCNFSPYPKVSVSVSKFET